MSEPSKTGTGEEPPAPPRNKRPPRRIQVLSSRPTSVVCISPLQLSEEEKAVLIECRRNSIARGIIAVLFQHDGLSCVCRYTTRCGCSDHVKMVYTSRYVIIPYFEIRPPSNKATWTFLPYLVLLIH